MDDSAEWAAGLKAGLVGFGAEAAAAADFLRHHRTRLGFHDQPTGARWTLDRRIELHPRYAALAPDDPYAVSLVIHEVRHLQQGVLTALSVYGELDAWQLQFGFLKDRIGHYHADPVRNAVIAELMALPLSWDRRMLRQVRVLMQKYAGTIYRIDLLPLYPLHRELLYRASHIKPARTG